MSTFYTTAQVDEQAGLIGQRIRTIKTESKAYTDSVALTAEERTKLGGLESSKFLGTFLTSEDIPTIGAIAGNYADVDAGIDSTVERWIYDADSAVFVRSKGEIAGETSASIKTKYESNPNTNVFTDAEKAKLEGLSQAVAPSIETATDISSFLAALDSSINSSKQQATVYTILDSIADFTQGFHAEYKVNDEEWKTIQVTEPDMDQSVAMYRFIERIIQSTPEEYSFTDFEDVVTKQTFGEIPLFTTAGSSWISVDEGHPGTGYDFPVAFTFRSRTGEILGMSPDTEYVTSVEKLKTTKIELRTSIGTGVDIVQESFGGNITLISTAKVYLAGE